MNEYLNKLISRLVIALKMNLNRFSVMKKEFVCPLVAVTLVGFTATPTMACTGISSMAKDGAMVMARTIDWGGNEVENFYYKVYETNYNHFVTFYLIGTGNEKMTLFA